MTANIPDEPGWSVLRRTSSNREVLVSIIGDKAKVVADALAEGSVNFVLKEIKPPKCQYADIWHKRMYPNGPGYRAGSCLDPIWQCTLVDNSVPQSFLCGQHASAVMGWIRRSCNWEMIEKKK